MSWLVRHLRYSKGLAGVCGFKQDSRSEAFCTVPLQCHPKQCADKHLRPPTARNDTVAFILPS